MKKGTVEFNIGQGTGMQFSYQSGSMGISIRPDLVNNGPVISQLVLTDSFIFLGAFSSKL